MIFVSGTKRSGTSMWMQALIAAGYPSIGSPYSSHWEDSIKPANPRGFHESILRQGVFYATNPHPQTGEWFHPNKVRSHVVKVFIPGLIRSDFGYITKLVATMRHWRHYGPSIRRLYAMEDRWLRAQPDFEIRQRQARRSRSSLPAHVDWFLENFELLQDIATRQYPVNLTTYDAVIRDPEATLSTALAWLGGGDLTAAVRTIEPELQTKIAPDHDLSIEASHAEVFDELYETIDRGSPLGRSFLLRLNEVHGELAELYGSLSPERYREQEIDVPL